MATPRGGRLKLYSTARPSSIDSCLTIIGKYFDKGLAAFGLLEICSPEMLLLLVTESMSLDEVFPLELLWELLLLFDRPDSHFNTAASEPTGDFSDRSRRITAGGGRARRRLGPSETLTL